MAKKKQITKPGIPCVRVVIGGKQGVQPGTSTGDGCTIVGESRGGATKFALGREYRATSKSVSTPKKNKPCLGALKRKGCPVQLAFDKGQPFLRFCTAEKQPGIRLDVDTPKEAQERANAMCETWKQTGKFPEQPHQQLGRTRARRAR